MIGGRSMETREPLDLPDARLDEVCRVRLELLRALSGS